MYGDRYKDFAPLSDVERQDILRAEIGYALAEDKLGLGRFRDKYAAKMAATPDARAFDIVSAPLGTSGDGIRRHRPCRGLRRHARRFSARHEGALSGYERRFVGPRSARDFAAAARRRCRRRAGAGQAHGARTIGFDRRAARRRTAAGDSAGRTGFAGRSSRPRRRPHRASGNAAALSSDRRFNVGRRTVMVPTACCIDSAIRGSDNPPQ